MGTTPAVDSASCCSSFSFCFCRAAESDRHQPCTTTCMADTRKEQKMLKKDQRGAREIREEVGERIRDGADSQPIIRNPNRDRARGDWDRTGNHHDEEVQ